MVEIADVRRALANPSTDQLPDTVIDEAIETAEVQSEKFGSNIPQQRLDIWVKYKAAYLSYLAYTTKVERGISEVTPQMKSVLSFLKEECKEIEKEFTEEYGAPSVTIPMYMTETVEAGYKDQSDVGEQSGLD